MARAGAKRPHTPYTPELGAQICEAMSEGEPWQAICLRDKMPAYSTLYLWMQRYPEFGRAVEHARTASADWKAHRALQVAEMATRDTATQDRLHAGMLMRHAAAITPTRWGGKVTTPRPASGSGKAKILAVRVRVFEPFERPDGRVVTREVFPDGSFEIYER